MWGEGGYLAVGSCVPLPSVLNTDRPFVDPLGLTLPFTLCFSWHRARPTGAVGPVSGLHLLMSGYMHVHGGWRGRLGYHGRRTIRWRTVEPGTV